MKHFLEINQLSLLAIQNIIARAMYFKQSKNFPKYPQYTLANLFYENSTRTRVSFEIAAKHLNVNVINIDIQNSSEKKGEVVEDTIQTLAAMGVNIFVIRHSQNGFLQAIAGALHNNERIINAGDGTNAHPSQAILDFMTIIEKKPDLSNLKIAIVGDILHSRVANSLQSICSLYQVKELVLVAPPILQPNSIQYGHKTSSLIDGISNADVIITLRMQKERFDQLTNLDIDQYHKDFGLTSKTIKHAKKDVMIMHPGPINRGVEIDSDIADGPNSCILNQVTNGIYTRMAIIESLINSYSED